MSAMSKICVKFDAITYRGDVIYFNHDYVYNIDSSILVDDVVLYNQVDDWLTELDKMDIIYKYELSSIIDFEIISIDDIIFNPILGIGEQLLSYYADSINKNQLYLDSMAVYNEIKHTINDLPSIDQIRIIISTQNVAYLSAINTYNEIREMNERLELELEFKNKSTQHIELYDLIKSNKINYNIKIGI